MRIRRRCCEVSKERRGEEELEFGRTPCTEVDSEVWSDSCFLPSREGGATNICSAVKDRESFLGIADPGGYTPTMPLLP